MSRELKFPVEGRSEGDDELARLLAAEGAVLDRVDELPRLALAHDVKPPALHRHLQRAGGEGVGLAAGRIDLLARDEDAVRVGLQDAGAGPD